MTHAFINAVFQCSLTPSSESKVHYSSDERDPLLLARKLSRCARSGRACQLAEAYIFLTQSADVLRSGRQHTIAAACLIKAYNITQGFVELSPLYRSIMRDLLQPLIGRALYLTVY